MKKLLTPLLSFGLIIVFLFSMTSCFDFSKKQENNDQSNNKNESTSEFTSIKSTVSKSTLAVGEKISITTSFSQITPENTALIYESDNDSIAKVSSEGVITAISEGTAKITVISVQNKNITSVLTIEVYNKDIMDLPVSEVLIWGTSGKIPISFKKGTEVTEEKLSFKISDKSGQNVTNSIIDAHFKNKDGIFSLVYSFNDEAFMGDLIISITYTDENKTVTRECLVKKTPPVTAEFILGNEFELYTDMTSQIPFILTPDESTNVEYDIALDNDNVSARMLNGSLVVSAIKAGVTNLRLTVRSAAFSESFTTSVVTVITKPRNLAVVENSVTYGIENLLTIGNFEYNYQTNSLINTSETKNKISLHYAMGSKIGSGFSDNFIWVSDTPDVYIDKNGVISFANDSFVGTVNFHGEFTYGSAKEKTEPISIRCVGNGVNVYSYKDLWYATQNELPVILHNNIKEDFGYIDGKKDIKYKEIHTTYDDTYYKNTNSLDAAKVKILIEFKNNVYGNGYTINAHNAAYGCDSAGKLKPDALFKGPLNFIAMHETNASITVKGQDNICFALYEGVTVNNVELRGCDLETDSKGNVDLTDLVYTGTTVEILGNGVSIEYSRLTNGRNVLRAFGDATDSSKIIKTQIKNTIFSGSKEFLILMGSNCFVDGDYKTPYPKLPGDTKNEYSKKENYQHLTAEEKQQYDEKFIKTFVNVKNSVFKDAGLFAIGISSHFSGKGLADGNRLVYSELGSAGNLFKIGDKTALSLIDPWKNLAKTSYGAKLTFEEQVEVFTWKKTENLDSSTLIDVPENSIFHGKIDFDVAEIVGKVPNKNQFAGLTYKENGEKYVHAGIVFFGGGKNYSVFESKATKNHPFSTYKIGLDEIGKDYFRFVAGEEDFYFLVYNASSVNEGYGYKNQQERLGNGGDGYDCIYKK